jgi:ATP synthase F1 complex assembly factor 2
MILPATTARIVPFQGRLVSRWNVVRPKTATRSRRSRVATVAGISALRRSTSAAHAATARDTRLAGRRRFYKIVGTTPSQAPWVTLPASETAAFVESPISAGVDNTDSATGVVRRGKLDHATLRTFLQPRSLPGSTRDGPADEQSFDWHGVTLDGRVLRTPLGQPLSVPSVTLATMIAAEWNAQTPYIVPTQMPLMTLACTALDQTSRQMRTYQETSLNFVGTDTICYWEDPMEDRGLYQAQERLWGPIHELVKQQTGHALAQTLGSEGVLVAKNASKLFHPPALYDYAREFVAQLDAWQLTTLHACAAEAKSFWLAWSLLMHQQQTQQQQQSSLMVDLEGAIQAARVEEEYQIANWGLVEGGHDYDRLNSSIQIRSARAMLDCIALDRKV